MAKDRTPGKGKYRNERQRPGGPGKGPRGKGKRPGKHGRSRTPGGGSAEQKPRERFSRVEGKEKPRRTTVAVREPEEEMRLNKFLAHAGIAARRKADEIIAAGEIMINGKVVTELGTKVQPGKDVVKYRGNEVMPETQLIYILLNKPKDTITTVEDEKGRHTVMELIPDLKRVFPVGRLDRNTTGVLLLTNDGDLAYALMHPKFEMEKAYVAELDKKITIPELNRLQKGIALEDGMTAPCEAEILDPPFAKTVGIVLHEGRNRQVRRMFEALGCDVKKLERIQYAGLTAAGLRRGGWRYLDEHEVQHLQKLAAQFQPPAGN